VSGDERFYTPDEVAELLGVTHVAVRKWIKAGRLKAFKNHYGMYRIPESEVKKLIEERSSLKSFTIDVEELRPEGRP
jgi:excisionase family DNA binding protein